MLSFSSKSYKIAGLCFWNRKKLRIDDSLPENHGNVADLNQRLQTSIRIAQDMLTYAMKEKIKDLISFLKHTFKPDLDPKILASTAKEAAARQPLQDSTPSQLIISNSQNKEI